MKLFPLITETNLYKVIIFSVFLFSYSTSISFAQTFTDNTPAGPETWTVPAGVNSITVECWGAGGAGGGSTSNGNGGSGGGGGAYASNTFTVTPGQIITYTVGAGGIGSLGNGNDGEFSTILTLTANGGTGGTANSGAVGLGGTASGGSINISGQDGIAGGASGGAGGNGANGGSGGLGGADSNGGAGTIPGGAGGGAERANGNNGDRSGGAGANGQIRISYIVCFNPTVNSVTSITSTSATINWTAPTPSPSNGYQYVVSNANTIPTGAGTATSLTSININTLNPSTTYYVFVRSNCGSGFSSWAGPLSFTTMAGPTPPSNDNPCNAITLVVNTSCSFSTYTNANATDSGLIAPGCANYLGGDIWFSITVPSSGNVIIDTNTGVITDSGMAVYSGTCGALNLVECDDDDSANGLMSFIALTGRTPGETLYIRVWEYGNNNNGTFDICVYSTTPPVNDDCLGAISLNVNPDQNCGFTTSGTIEGATDSGQNNCGGTEDDDVWFSFVATETTHYIDLLNVSGTSTDLYHAVYDGTCGSLGTAILCSDPNSSVVNGLTPGNTYFVQVYSWTSTYGQNTDFDICVGSPPPPCVISLPLVTTPVCPSSVTAGGLGLNGADPSPISGCSGTTCTDLEATYLQLGETTDYTVDYISYNPPSSFDTGYTSTGISNDDTFSGAINLPFDFCFYDTIYSQLVISTNGMVSFDTSLAGDYANWSIDFSLPNSDFYDNSIYGVFQDLYPPLGGQIGYKSTTVGGCNVFIVSWHDVPMFSSSCNTSLYTGMIVLYENTNIIEVYIEEKNLCSSWNDGNAAVGIQGIASASEGIAAPCRNGLDLDWTTNNEAWRFVPSGNSTTTVTWYEGSGTSGPVLGTTDSINVCPIATTTYTAEVTYNYCNGTSTSFTDETTVTVSGNKTWNGSLDDEWATPGNWTPIGAPTISDCVVIPDTGGNDPLILDGIDAEALNVTILSGANITIENLGSLTVQDFINGPGASSGDIILQGSPGAADGSTSSTSASLIQVNNTTNTGSIILNRQAYVRTQDFVYWSSPVEDYAIGGIASTIHKYKWNPTVPTNPGEYGIWVQTPSSEIMSIGRGYAVRGPVGNGNSNTVASWNNVQFTGTPNNGTILTPINCGSNTIDIQNNPNPNLADITGDDDNWNLVGNPYPSALNADDFLTLNSDTNNRITGTIWLWTHVTRIGQGNNNNPFYGSYAYNYDEADYLEYNLLGPNPAGFSGVIASGQGFFVLMDDLSSPSSTIEFNNSMRSASIESNAQFLRIANPESETNSSEKHRIWVDFVNQENNEISTVLLGYAEGATVGYDKLYDAPLMTGSSNKIFMPSTIDNMNFVIQGRPLPFDNSDIVPLSVVIDQIGTYGLGVENYDGLFDYDNQDVFIEDLELDTIHNIKDSPYYFTANAIGLISNRFLIRFVDNTLGIDELNNINLNIIAPNNEFIKVTSGTTQIQSVKVYDLLGRVLIDKQNINASEFTINNVPKASGAYIVKATLVNGIQKIQKVVLKF